VTASDLPEQLVVVARYEGKPVALDQGPFIAARRRPGQPRRSFESDGEVPDRLKPPPTAGLPATPSTPEEDAVTFASRPQRAEPVPKYPPSLVEHVRKAYEAGSSQVMIAKSIGRSQNYVSRLMLNNGLTTRPSARGRRSA